MKKLALLLATVLLLCFFASCDFSKPSPLKPNTPSSSETSEDSSEESSLPPSDEETSSASSQTTSSQPENKPVEIPSVHSSHYCFTMLSDIQKIYYDKMYTAVNEMSSGWISLGPIGGNYKADIAVARTALANDHPQLFWISPYYACATTEDNKTALVLFSASPSSENPYLILRSERAGMTSSLESAIREITSQVTASDPYGIELQLHDLLCSRVTYSSNAADPMAYTAYGALVNRSAVCEGYSRAMQLLLDRFGIKSVLVSGVAGGAGHMWNAVNLGGEWYHLDATWNDSKTDMISHEHFNLSDSVMRLDHHINANYTSFAPEALENGEYAFNIKTPVCSGTQNNYFAKNGFIFRENGEDALAEYIVNSDKTALEVAFGSHSFRNLFALEELDRIANINLLIKQNYPDFNLQIGGYSVSTSVLRLYLKEPAPTPPPPPEDPDEKTQ